jgi:pimeloyl-ACP methyl ester carboxylesterase
MNRSARHRAFRALRIFSGIIAAVTIAVLGFAYVVWPAVLPNLIYSPRALGTANLSPEEWGYGGEVLRIPEATGDTILGWLLRHTNSKPNGCTVLFTHGNAGNIASQAAFMRPFLSAGFDALVFDYRGYGASSGHASEEHLYEDAERAYEYLERDGIAPHNLLIVGHSLGTAVATELASTRESAGVVLAAPFTSLPAAMRERVPWFPVGLLRWTRERFDSESHIANVSAPMLFVVASADRIVPRAAARALYESAKGRRSWVEVPGGHNDVFRNGEFEAALERFVSLLPACGGEAPE